MPLLGGLLVTLASGFANWLVQFVGQKVAIALAYVAALGVVTAALLAVLTAAVVPLLSGLFAVPWFGWMGLAYPPVATACITALGVTWSATTLYGWQREALRIAASV